MNERKIINILWTGGWDSTFRMVELSRMSVTVQAVYVIDSNRKSVNNELKAMNEILTLLKEREETKANFLPIKKINLENIPMNHEITQAYKTIHEKTKLGSQHEWLARLATEYPGIELGTEAGSTESSHILKAIALFGVLHNNEGKMVLDKEKSSREGMLVLGNVSFPIIDKTEQDMKRLIGQWGYEDVMKHIWFCHSPLNGLPCGICHPCQVKIASDMDYLLPEKSVKRGRRYKLLESLFGERVANKFYNLFLKKNS